MLYFRSGVLWPLGVGHVDGSANLGADHRPALGALGVVLRSDQLFEFAADRLGFGLPGGELLGVFALLLNAIEALALPLCCATFETVPAGNPLTV